MNAFSRAGRWLYPALLAALGLALLLGGWSVSSELTTGLQLAVAPLLLAGFVALRHRSERVNPPQDERQRQLERSVMAIGFVAMFVAALVGMVWELGRGLAVTELRATGVLLIGGVAVMAGQLVLQRRY